MIDYSSPDEPADGHKPDDDEYGEDDDDSSLDEGELNSAQKIRLKNDLLRMGYDEDEEEFGATADADDYEDDDNEYLDVEES